MVQKKVQLRQFLNNFVELSEKRLSEQKIVQTFSHFEFQVTISWEKYTVCYIEM